MMKNVSTDANAHITHVQIVPDICDCSYFAI